MAASVNSSWGRLASSMGPVCFSIWAFLAFRLDRDRPDTRLDRSFIRIFFCIPAASIRVSWSSVTRPGPSVSFRNSLLSVGVLPKDSSMATPPDGVSFMADVAWFFTLCPWRKNDAGISPFSPEKSSPLPSGFFFSGVKLMDASFMSASSTSNLLFLLDLYFISHSLAISMAFRRKSSEVFRACSRNFPLAFSLTSSRSMVSSCRHTIRSLKWLARPPIK